MIRTTFRALLSAVAALTSFAATPARPPDTRAPGTVRPAPDPRFRSMNTATYSSPISHVDRDSPGPRWMFPMS
jgi:hypothetical protein